MFSNPLALPGCMVFQQQIKYDRYNLAVFDQAMSIQRETLKTYLVTLLLYIDDECSK